LNAEFCESGLRIRSSGEEGRIDVGDGDEGGIIEEGRIH
jgi:hypothetical protein